MAQPGEAAPVQRVSNEGYLELLSETLEGLEEAVRGAFLQRFFRTLAQLELSEAQSLECWQQVLARQREMNESQGQPVALHSALMDVLIKASFFRAPLVVEYEELRRLRIDAATDSLTGLHNRRLFDEYCDKELNRAKRYGHNLALVVLDLHRLKEVNDQFGHMRGDTVLQLAARSLRKTLRISDFAFRIGGDEFALLLPQTDQDQAVTLCRRLRAQYEEELRPLNLGIAVSLDYGIAVHPQDGDNKTALMQLADRRLYELKHSQRSAARVIPLEAPTREPAAPPARPTPSAVPQPAPATPARPQPYAIQRKWERVSLAGTRSYATLDVVAKQAAVVDLSYGGVALLLEQVNDLPEQFYAVLHVPILPPTRVRLRKVYSQGVEGGRMRVGCLFVA